MRIGAAYIRVSTDDQLEYSPDSQLHKIKEYAKANGIILSDEYIFREEEGRSGRNASRRPEFQRMVGIAKTKPKPFDVILLWKFSRFARNREDSVVYKSMLRKQCGIEVLSVSENIGDDKMSILIEAFIEAMDEWYSINLSEEVTRGMSEKARRGGVVGSPAYGYTVKNGVFVPHPEESKIVQYIFDKFVNENMGYRDIAVLLNNMGVRSKKGFPMENRTVEYLLCNPVYIGKIRWSPNGRTDRNWNKPDLIVANGGHEPIIPLSLFEQAQDKMAIRKKMYAKYARQEQKNDDFLLRGIIRCSNCGSTLVRSANGLQCHSYSHGICRKSHYISMKNAEDRVIEMLQNALKDKKFDLIIKQPQNAASSNALIEAQIQREQMKLMRVRVAYEDGVDTLEEYKKNKSKITATIESMKLQIPCPTTSTRVSKDIFLKKLGRTILDLQNPELSTGVKNGVLRSIIDQIIFSRDQNKFQIFYYI